MNANVMARWKEVNNTLVTGGNHDRGDLSKGRRGYPLWAMRNRGVLKRKNEKRQEGRRWYMMKTPY